MLTYYIIIYPVIVVVLATLSLPLDVDAEVLSYRLPLNVSKSCCIVCRLSALHPETVRNVYTPSQGAAI